VREMITSGRYRVFHNYLEARYADTVVLTFRQIEDLLGFALPAPARTDPAWWTKNAPAEIGDSRCSDECSDAWTVAHRTAKANVAAQHVVFERVG
jgi:hypothetical protein